MSDDPWPNPDAAHGADQPEGVRTDRTVRADERAALAAALDDLANAVGAVHDHLQSASPATRTLIAEHEGWPENFIWTDGSQVAEAARRIAALLHRHPDAPAVAAPTRRRRQPSHGR